MPNDTLYPKNVEVDMIFDNFSNKYTIQYFYDLYYFSNKYDIIKIRQCKEVIKKCFYELYYDLLFHSDNLNNLQMNKDIFQKISDHFIKDDEKALILYKFIFWDVVDIVKCTKDDLYKPLLYFLIDFIDNNDYYNFEKYKSILYQSDYEHKAEDDYYFGTNNQYNNSIASSITQQLFDFINNDLNQFQMDL